MATTVKISQKNLCNYL